MTKIDSLGKGLGAARDELATLQLTEIAFGAVRIAD